MAEKAAVCTLWGSSRTLRNLQLLPPIECVAGEESKLEEMRVSHHLCRLPSQGPIGVPLKTLGLTGLNLTHLSIHYNLQLK